MPRTRRAVFGSALAIMVVLTGGAAPVGAAEVVPVVNVKSPVESAGVPDSQSIENLDAETLAIMRHQERLNPALTVLTEAAMKVPDSGFVSVGFEGDGITLYWKGDLPPSMNEAVAAVRRTAPVRVRPAPYSRAELEVEAAKLEKAAGPLHDIQAIAFRNDGSGLIVEKMAPATLALVQAKAGRTPTTAEKALSRAGLTVPVELVAAESSMSFQACAGGMCRRTDDEAWWNSGGRVRMRHATNQPFYGACTSGFAVLYLGTTYLLTAAHCATWHAGLGDWFYDGAGELIGRASIVEDWDKDIMLIDARGWYWMWDGSTTTTNHRTVRSWASPAWNELVCLSGAFSGTQCSLEVDLGTFAYQLTDSDGDTFIVHGMTRACRPVGSPSPSQSGDSGAPVFTLDGSGVRAKGIHSGGDGRCILFQGMGNITSARSGAWPGVTPYTG